jgi:hypothetical protein
MHKSRKKTRQGCIIAFAAFVILQIFAVNAAFAQTPPAHYLSVPEGTEIHGIAPEFSSPRIYEKNHFDFIEKTLIKCREAPQFFMGYLRGALFILAGDGKYGRNPVHISDEKGAFRALFLLDRKSVNSR